MNQEMFMRIALDEARRGTRENEVPVGAAVVCDGKVVAVAHDMREGLCDPTAHAEILALRKAAGMRNAWQLDGCDLYVTLEPCPMCAGAVLMARIRTVVFGAQNPKSGALSILQDFFSLPHVNHRVKVIGGVLQDECECLLTGFFEEMRRKG